MKWNEMKSNVKRNKNANIVYRTEVYRISICVVVGEDNDNNQSSSSIQRQSYLLLLLRLLLLPLLLLLLLDRYDGSNRYLYVM